ncbi:MAG: tetratricopeptide repeat protein, partial [Planctomycetaceae bacterium]|nr:tetratricopeptide repeat protein [Planctomycetaceae bacterium]
ERGDEAAAFELFGRAFLAAKRVDQAQAAFDRSLAVKPDAALQGWFTAQVAAAREQPEQALAALDKYFQAHRTTHGLEPYQLLERVLTQLKQQETLLERLATLAAADPGNPLLRFFLAEQYRAAGQLERAEPLYAQLAKEKPSLDVYQAQLDLYRRQRDVGALLKILAASLAQLRQIELLGEEGQALLADEALTDEILAAAVARLAEEPASFSAAERAGLGSYALSAKRFEPAGKLFESALKLAPDDERDLLRRWGLGLLLQERPGEAAAIFRRVPAGETAAAQAQRLYHLSGALELDGQSDAALEAARTAAELAEAHREPLAEAYYAILGRVPWVLFHAKRYEAAREAYAAQLARFEKQTDNKLAREAAREARLMLSNLAAIEENLPQAEEWLEQILDEAPDDVSAANDLGYIWVDQGKHLERSLRMIQFAVAQAPENGAYRDSLGWAWFQLGKYDEAIAELNKALELIEDPDGVILDHLGDALQKAGRPEAALDAWQKAVAAFEREQETRKAEATRAKIAHAPAANP